MAIETVADVLADPDFLKIAYDTIAIGCAVLALQIWIWINTLVILKRTKKQVKTKETA